MADCVWGDKIIDNPFLLIQPTDRGERVMANHIYGLQASELQHGGTMEYHARLQQAAMQQLSASRGQQGLQNALSGGMGGASIQNTRIQDWQNAGLSQAQIEANLRYMPFKYEPPILTQDQKDMLEAEQEVNAIIREVQAEYEAYDRIGEREVEELLARPLTPDENSGKE